MASKKKTPSFEIPDAVREAGQSGWVYRTTDKEKPAAPRSTRAARARSTRSARAPEIAEPEAAVQEIAPVAPAIVDTASEVATSADLPEPPTTAAAPQAAAAQATIAGRVLGFGLQVAAVPLVVPLYLTAAVSRRLGLTKAE